MGERSSLEDELISRALTAYSDSCTIPTLTPSCPYYRVGPQGPTCGEECRQALRERGVARPTTSVTVLGGLVMTGVSRPIEIASGASLFDATEAMLRDLESPVASANTSSLLLRLRRYAATPPGVRTASEDGFYDIWRELERRGLDVVTILRVGISPTVADVITQMAPDLPASDPWRQLWDSQLAQKKRPDDYRKWYATHATEWLARLVETDLQGFLAWNAPAEALFSSVPPTLPEPEALWLWERFTVTHVSDWTTSSLVMEWGFSRGRITTQCGDRVLAARTIDPTEVATVALDRLAESTPQTFPQSRDLSSEQFVHKAVRHLQEGRPEEAADIFTALAFMNPADGEALNNLGFCLIPQGAAQAIGPLDRASRLPLRQPALNTANRAFVRHLLGRDAEALALLEGLEAPDAAAFAWCESDCGTFSLRSVTIPAYVDELRQHITKAAPATE